MFKHRRLKFGPYITSIASKPKMSLRSNHYCVMTLWTLMLLRNDSMGFDAIEVI